MEGSELSSSGWFFDLSGMGDGVEMAEAEGVDDSGLAACDCVAEEVDTDGWWRDSLAE
jgi:hypothetical protein